MGTLRDGAGCGLSPEEYIAGIPMWTRKKNSLADIHAFLDALGAREKNIIHVAGTNGKGSVCAYLTSILNASGYSTGTFVSPHLTDIKERFLLDGIPVREDDFTPAFERVLSLVNDKCEEGFCHPSYFEFCFLLAMTLFTERDVDFTILETGLGGRLDATNAVRAPLACVITSISLDHTQYLGNTIKEIAAEKAGIIKPHIPVIFDANDIRAAALIENAAKEMDAPAYPMKEGGPASEEDLTAFKDISFSAPYQKMNADLSVKTLDVLAIPGVTPGTVHEGLSSVRWQGRMEEISPHIWLDGAHNPGGINAFIRAVKEKEKQSGPTRTHLLFAVADDKDYPAMIHLLCSQLKPERVTVTAFEGERAADIDELPELFLKEGCLKVQAVKDAEAALCAAVSGLKDMSGEPADLYIIGSLYLIGALRPSLAKGEYFIDTGDLKNA